MTKRIVMVVDETGSMASRIAQTLDAFAEYLSTLDDDTIVSVLLFNSAKMRWHAKNQKRTKVRRLTVNTYSPNYLTPLVDAVMKAIGYAEAQSKKKDTVGIMVQTDGMENASKDYTTKDLAKKMETCRERGWAFHFLGADMDAWDQAQKLGFSEGQTMSYSDGARHTTAAFRASGAKMSDYLRSGATGQSMFDPEDRVGAGEAEVLVKVRKGKPT